MKKFLVIFALGFVLSGCQGAAGDFADRPAIQVPQIQSPHDEDQDGVDDFTDIVAGARSLIGVVTEYDTSYYSEGYPPSNKGACADVIWRALKGVGYDFKKMMDEDIKASPGHYNESSLSDSNINFRRVVNIRAFLEQYAEKLTTDVTPYDEDNLSEWQGGDIVTYAQIPGGLWHIGIVSDKRRRDGVPLLIHNYGRGVREDDYLLNWPTEITGHYRFTLDDV